MVEFCLKLYVSSDWLKLIFSMINDTAMNIISQPEAKYVPKPCIQP